ncbi:MAG TPA: Ada metal-binding domain-containing protein [Brevundimonas sp.]|jgi:AraC family transcriptional regulator of adaptative response / DNA-3-methyladenine glycosylase II
METDRTALDQEACYRAVLTRDVRFDGRFFGGVTSTGIYCRPVCPARTPRRENMIFYPTAAAAEEAGFRACLRCRPETAPDMGAWRGTSNTVSRALSLIEAGALDEADVETLAGRLGVGERQLRRLFRQHLGAAPVSVAQTRRVLLAKALIHETDLTMAEVALASGFGSVRRFNETFQSLYGRPPSALRRRKERVSDGGVRLSLPYRPPYDWDAMLAALAARGDAVEGRMWSRTLDMSLDGAEGRVCVTCDGAGRVEDRVQVRVETSDLRVLPGVLARVRRVFDLSADPDAIARDLSVDAALHDSLRARPGLRLPGDWVDSGVEPPNDRLPEDFDARLIGRTEMWRPWRAYGALHLLTAEGAKLMEVYDGRQDDDARAA